MPVFTLTVGEGPIVATAVHHGHDVRAELIPLLAVATDHRLREEDPFTGDLASLAPTRVIGCRSRFEVDLNRPRNSAVYATPAAAWGIDVWREPPLVAVVERSLANYDLFYATVFALLNQLAARHGHVVVLDLHSYNHRRGGADDAAASNPENPEVNLGTASVDRDLWGPLVDRFASDLCKQFGVNGLLDVRENVKFQGGHVSRWINATFPERVVAIAVEFKKTFMDEWTGQLDHPAFAKLQTALTATFPGLLTSLAAMKTNVTP